MSSFVTCCNIFMPQAFSFFLASLLAMQWILLILFVAFFLGRCIVFWRALYTLVYCTILAIGLVVCSREFWESKWPLEKAKKHGTIWGVAAMQLPSCHLNGTMGGRRIIQALYPLCPNILTFHFKRWWHPKCWTGSLKMGATKPHCCCCFCFHRRKVCLWLSWSNAFNFRFLSLLNSEVCGLPFKLITFVHFYWEQFGQMKNPILTAAAGERGLNDSLSFAQ